MITDKQEALEAIKLGTARLQDIIPEIIDTKMVLAAIKEYGNEQYSYATRIGVQGLHTGEFKKEAKAIADRKKKIKKPKNVEQDYNEGEVSKPMYSYNYGSQLNFEEIEEPEEPEPIDYGFEAPESIDYEFETPEPIDYGFEAPEQPNYDFEEPEQPVYNTATLGDEVSIQDSERKELTMELMKQIELSQGKSAEVAKLDKGIKGLENLEHQYANALDKSEGKEF